MELGCFCGELGTVHGLIEQFTALLFNVLPNQVPARGSFEKVCQSQAGGH